MQGLQVWSAAYTKPSSKDEWNVNLLLLPASRLQLVEFIHKELPNALTSRNAYHIWLTRRTWNGRENADKSRVYATLTPYSIRRSCGVEESNINNRSFQTTLTTENLKSSLCQWGLRYNKNSVSEKLCGNDWTKLFTIVGGLIVTIRSSSAPQKSSPRALTPLSHMMS